MDALPAPALEARISPELRRLLRELRVERDPSTGPLTAEPYQCQLVTVQRREQAASVSPWDWCSLRRDGARPARFRGALVLEWKSPHEPDRGYLRLFATAKGEAVAHLVYLPPEYLPARPIFRATRVDTADALHRLVAETGPEECFSVCPDVHLPPAHRDACEMLRLPVELPGLAVPEGSPVPSMEGTPA
jgi:hypothetical protein